MDFGNMITPTQLAACFGLVRQRSAVPGSDGVTPEAFGQDLDWRLAALSQSLLGGSYRPAPLVRLRIDKPGGGTRRLAIPTVADRVVIEALRRALGGPIEAQLGEAAYAYRPRRSARAAVQRVQRGIREGATFVALGDIRDFFDSVPILAVLDGLRGLRLDPEILRLCETLLMAHALRPGRGLAQGAALSPLLSNLVLAPVDRRLLRAGWSLIRYCDNLCVPTRSEAEAQAALQLLQRELARLALLLKSSASQVVAVQRGFLWLGFWLGAEGLQVSAGAVAALRARVAAAAAGCAADALRERLDPIIRGWAQYFDMPLPADVDLGEHGALVRALLAEHQAGPDAGPDAAPDQGSEAEEIDAHDWAQGEAEAEGDEDREVAPSTAVARLLDEADQRASSGEFARAEALYEEAQRLANQPVPQQPGPEPIWSEEVIDAFIGLFAAGQERFEVARGLQKGRRDFALVERQVESGDVREHLLGRAALAIRPRLPDGTCTLGVIDVDGSGAGTAVAVAAYAQALCGAARVLGIAVLLEHTGGRGAHVFVPVAGRARAAAMAGLLKGLVAAAGTPAAGVKTEILPAGDDAPELHQQAITLPLGVHLETGERSLLSLGDGTTVAGELRALVAVPGNTPEIILAHVDQGVGEGAGGPGEEERQDAARTVAAVRGPVVNQAEEAAWEEHGGAVARMMEGCAVLRHLAHKAETLGHLDHGERLSLLYSLGHLGPAGERAIHTIVARCRDYDPAETERQIKKLSGLPIGCTRMREKHATPELLPQCACDFGEARRRGGYATPVLHALGFRRDWKKELQRRRDVDQRLRDPAERAVLGVKVTEVAAEGRPDGATLACAPPHEWA